MSDKLYFGLDIGGTSIKAGAFNADGNCFDKRSLATDLSCGGTRILPDAAKLIRTCVQELGAQFCQITAVGIGVPGPVLPNGHVERCVDLNWTDFDPAGELSVLLGVPCIAANDADLAALGEYWKGSGAGIRTMMLVTLGTGVGGGVVLNGGILLTGLHGIGGEIGHTVVDTSETQACACGNHGCLDQYASARGIVRKAESLLAESQSPSVLRCTPGALTCKDVLDAARAGDAIAAESVEFCVDRLGRGLANAACILDPDVFVIGGGVSSAGEYLLKLIREAYARHMKITAARAQIRLASLGNDAGICGAAKLAMELGILSQTY